MELNIMDHIPDRLLESGPEALVEFLPGPTLFRLQGEEDPPLFVSTLLHGDEPTGYLAIRDLLKKYQGQTLPRSLWLFLGNVEAAQQKLRHLPAQRDFNRIWNGGSDPEHRLAQQVLDIARSAPLFASVDIHNNTGLNPHYACVNKLEGPFLQLAKLFGPTMVYFTRPKEVISIAFSKICPAVTIECGQPGDDKGVRHAFNYLDLCLNLGAKALDREDIEDEQVYHTIARIIVPPEYTIGFNPEQADTDFTFIPELDRMNFSEQPENTILGWRHNASANLIIQNEEGEEVSEDFLKFKGKEIRLKRSVVPCMFTTNAEAIMDDCLGYLMQRYILS